MFVTPETKSPLRVQRAWLCWISEGETKSNLAKRLILNPKALQTACPAVAYINTRANDREASATAGISLPLRAIYAALRGDLYGKQNAEVCPVFNPNATPASANAFESAI